MSKSRPFRNTTDIYEEDRMLIWSATIFEQLALMMQLLTYWILSMFPYKEMTFKISIQDGIKLSYLQVTYPREFVQVEDTRVCSASDCIGCV